MPSQPPPTEDKPAPRRKRRRWGRRLLIGFGLLVVLVGLAYVFRQALFGDYVARRVSAKLSEVIGVPVRVERVLGSWVSDARVEDVSIDTDAAKGVIAGFEADALQVRFSLWELLVGDKIKSIEGIEAENLNLTLDFTRPVAQTATELSLSELVSAVPKHFPPTDIRAKLTVITGAGVAVIEHVVITSPGDQILRLDSDRIVLPQPAGEAGELHARIRRDDRGLVWQSDSEVAGITLRQVTVDHGGALVARGRVAEADLDIRLEPNSATVQTGELQIDAVPEWALRLLPSQMFRPTAGTLALDLDLPSLSPLRMRAKITGDAIDFPDERIQSLAAEATIEDGTITVTSATVKARDASLDVHELVLRTAPDFAVASLKQLDVEIGNIQSWIKWDRPLALEIFADSPDADSVHLHKVTLIGPGTELRGSGRFQVPDDLDDLTSASFEADLEGKITDNAFGPLSIRGELSVKGRAFGTILDPQVDAHIWGNDVALNGHRVQHLDVEGAWHQNLYTFRRLALRSDVGQVHGSTTFELDPFFVQVSDLSYSIDSLAELRTLLPASLKLPLVRGAARGTAKLRGSLERITGDVTLAASGLVVADVEVGSVQIEAVGEGNEVRITAADARGTWGHLSGEGALQIAERTAQIDKLDGQVKGHTLALQQPAEIRVGDQLAISGLDLEVFGGHIRGDAIYDNALQRADVHFEGLDLGSMQSEVQGTARGTVTFTEDSQALQVAVEKLRYRGAEGTLTIDLTQTDAGLRIDALNVALPGLVRASGSGLAPVRIDLDGIQPQRVDDAATFTLTASADELRRWLPDAPGRAATVTIAGQGDDITFEAALKTIAVVPNIDPLAGLSIRGTLNANNATFTGAFLDDPRIKGTFEGTTDRGWAWRAGSWPTSLRDAVVKGTGKVAMPSANVIIPFLPLCAVQAEGTMDGDLTFSGSFDTFVLEGFVKAKDLRARLRNTPGWARIPVFEARIVERKLKVTKIHIAHELTTDAIEPIAETLRVQPKDALDVPELIAADDIFGAAHQNNVTGMVTGELDILGIPHNPALDGWIRGADLKMPFPTLGTTALLPELMLRFKGNRVTIADANIAFGKARIVLGGWMMLPVGKDERPFSDMPFDTFARLTEARLEALAEVLPIPKGSKGTVSGKVSLTNTPGSPNVTGSFEGKDIEVPLAGWEKPIRVPSIQVTAEGGQVKVSAPAIAWGRVQAGVEGTLTAPATLDGNWLDQQLDARVRLDAKDLSVLEEVSDELRRIDGQVSGEIHARGLLRSPKLDGSVDLNNVRGALPGSLPSLDQLTGKINFQDRAIQIVNMRGQLGHSPFTISGSAQIPDGAPPELDIRFQGQNLRLLQTRDMRLRSDVDLVIAGPFGNLSATGNLRITDLVFVASMDLLGGGPETADEGLEFFRFPAEPFASMKLDVRVRADNTIRVRTNVLSGNLSADVTFKGTGRAPVPVGRAFATDVLVKLPFSTLKVERGELRFTEDVPNQPIIDAAARTEMKGFDINVRVRGRLPDVEIRTSSVPPLRESEALLLLTTGATSEELRSEGLARAALTRIGSVFGRSLLSGGRGPSDPDDRGFFDRFTFTQGRRVSRNGQDTLEAEFEATDRFYLRVARDRYEDFNASLVWKWRFR